MLRRRLAGIYVAGCLLASAQDAVHLASIGGRVLDPTGAAVQGARVTARQTEMNLSRDTVTDDEGQFRLPYLRPGPWDIRAAHPGFSEHRRALVLSAGAAHELTFALSVGESETHIRCAGRRSGSRNSTQPDLGQRRGK